MFGYNKKQFECFIDYIENNIASITLIDEDGEKSSMEIPKDIFISSKINFKVGTIFSFTFRKFYGIEKVTFKPIKKKMITTKERNKIIKKYDDKYGDL